MWKKIEKRLQEWEIMERSYTISPTSEALYIAATKALNRDYVGRDGSEIISRAIAHYCQICDMGFRTVGNTKNHKRLKHKNVDKSVDN